MMSLFCSPISLRQIQGLHPILPLRKKPSATRGVRRSPPPLSARLVNSDLRDLHPFEVVFIAAHCHHQLTACLQHQIIRDPIAAPNREHPPQFQPPPPIAASPRCSLAFISLSILGHCQCVCSSSCATTWAASYKKQKRKENDYRLK